MATNYLAPPTYNSLLDDVPSLEPPPYVPPRPMRFGQRLENLSIGAGWGVTEQLQSREDFIRNPVQVTRETLQQLAALYDDPRLALEMLREVRRKAASGPLGMGEVIGSLVPLRVPRGRKPTMQEVNEPVDMTKRREKQIADEEEKEFRQYSSTLSDMKTLSLLKRFQQNQPAIDNLYRQHELIQKLRDVPLIGLRYIDNTLNKWEKFKTELVKGINDTDAFHLNNADFIYRDSNFSKEFNEYISSVLKARERLNPRSPKDRKIIKQIDDILGSDRITPIK